MRAIPIAIDPESRLKTVTVPGTTHDHVYGPHGRRVETKVDGLTMVTYLMDGPDVIAEFDDTGEMIRYIHVPGVDDPAVLVDAIDNLAFFHADATGTIVAMSGPDART